MIKAPGMSYHYCLGWNAARLISVGYFRRRALNPERVPATGPCILAGNHASFIDPFAMGSPVEREVFYLARKSAFKFPLSLILHTCNAIPMDREGGGLKGMLQIIDILKQGHAITLFPEGTRSPDGSVREAKAGIGLIVIKSGAPVVPIRIFGSFEAWGRHLTVPRPRRITVKYGHPLPFTALKEEAQNCSKDRLKEIYQEISVQIMDAIRNLKMELDQ
jgi:1-acyl-sn-glycerol-3-phosphate acyltransferase